jgi:hypothetical protein
MPVLFLDEAHKLYVPSPSLNSFNRRFQPRTHPICRGDESPLGLYARFDKAGSPLSRYSRNQRPFLSDVAQTVECHATLQGAYCVLAWVRAKISVKTDHHHR